MSLFNVEFSSSSGDEDIPILPFNPKIQKGNEQVLKPKYLQQPSPVRRTRRETPIKIEKTVGNVYELKATVIPSEHQEEEEAKPVNRRVRRTRRQNTPTKTENTAEIIPKVETKQIPKSSSAPQNFFDDASNSDSNSSQEKPQPEKEVAVKRQHRGERREFTPTQLSPKPRRRHVQPDGEVDDYGSDKEKEIQSPPSPTLQNQNVNNNIKIPTPETQTNEEPKKENEPERAIENTEIPKPKPHIAIPVEVKPKDMPMSDISRKKITSLGGTKYEFKYYYNTNLEMSAKYKKGGEYVAICQGETVHLKGPSYACLAIGNHGSDFSLRMGSLTGEEMLTMRFTPPEKDEYARKIIISFFSAKEGQPLRLFSRQPTLDQSKKLVYQFNGRFKLDSVKNAVLYEKRNKEDLMWIRKIRPDVLELNAAFELDHVAIFAIGLASFITNVK